MSLMYNVYKKQIDEFISVYLDGILVYSEAWSDHLKHLRIALSKLREQKLYGKLSKCTFGVKEIEYLGFILKHNGLAMENNKVQAIKGWEQPQNKKELQSFLGLVNYYRRFIKNCSKISKPLTTLTKDVPFIWNNDAETAFLCLKEAVTSEPVLKTFNEDYPIIVTADGSKTAIGAVLEQDHPEGRFPVAYFSRTLNGAEQNYAAHDLELLTIVDALRVWR